MNRDWTHIAGTALVAPLFVLLWAVRPGADWAPGPMLPVLALPVLAALLFRLSAPSARAPNRASGALRLLVAWQKVDVGVAAALIYLTVFRLPTGPLPAFLVWLALVALLWGARRFGAPAWLALAISIIALVGVLPRVFAVYLIAQVEAVHALDVDHRMWPDGGDINSDGVRFRAEGSDLSDDDFVVLFLGDSFTFGFNLPYESAYPYQFESLANSAECSATVRAVNFGWTSSWKSVV